MKEQIKQISILLGVIFLIVVELVLLTNGSGSGANKAAISGGFSGILISEETSYDFGTISMAKGKVFKDFVLENRGSSPVQIGEVYTSCMCTTAELRLDSKVAGPFGMQGMGFATNANLIVAPKDKLIIRAIFDPAAHGPAGVGPIERQITVYTSAGQDPIVLEFKAVVTP